MKKIERLKQEAREAATLLGHRMGKFRHSEITTNHPPTERPAAVAACEVCGVIVLVDPAPPQGEPHITGEGVNRPCSAIEQEGHEMA